MYLPRYMPTEVLDTRPATNLFNLSSRKFKRKTWTRVEWCFLLDGEDTVLTPLFHTRKFKSKKIVTLCSIHQTILGPLKSRRPSGVGTVDTSSANVPNCSCL
jgi:hypothetical protein